MPLGRIDLGERSGSRSNVLRAQRLQTPDSKRWPHARAVPAVSHRVSTRLLATQSDQRLLELLANGHERAFEAVVHRYRRPLLSYCRRMGLADSRAEDVLQQSLLKAWLALQGGTEVRELRPWLYRIVHNTAVNAMRSAPEEQGSELEAARMETVAVESQLERSIAAREALTDVAALPPMQRDAIVMSALDGRSHEEVASALGITNGAVRGLLYRARATLRSAAALLIPQPLLEWASGSASRAAPTAGRLAELSAGGGGEAGGMLLKGAAVAVTAALAAGAVLVPGHQRAAGQAAHRAGAGLADAAAAQPTGAGEGTAGAGAAALGAGRAASAGGQPARSTGSAPLLAGVSPQSTRTTTRAGGGGSQPGAGTPVRGAAPAGGIATGAAAASGHTVESTASGSANGTVPTEAVHTGETPPPGGTPGTGKEKEDGESSAAEREAEAAHEKAEREAEAAHEQAEREAEAAHEKAEREAEIARERREREAEEAEEAHEREGTKD
jgi:RNA polymerase sigma factor (sigma-70 family)